VDKDGRRLRGYDVTVENDELIVTCDEQLYAYNYKDPESQRVQETLFHEKGTSSKTACSEWTSTPNR
jgi:hypothetical protein